MRTLTLAVAAMALALALAGCTGTNENADDDNTQTIPGGGSSIEGTMTVVDNGSSGSTNSSTNSSG